MGGKEGEKSSKDVSCCSTSCSKRCLTNIQDVNRLKLRVSTDVLEIRHLSNI